MDLDIDIDRMTRTLHGEYVITLRKQKRDFVIVAYRGKNRVLLSWMGKRFPQLASIFACTSLRDNTLYVSLGKLEQVKSILLELDDPLLIIEIDPKVQRLHLDDVPPSLIISYHWVQGREALIQDLGGAKYAGAGWFYVLDTYFQIPTVGLADDQILNRSEITGSSLVNFLRKDVLLWHKRGVPFHCDLSYRDHPFVTCELVSTFESQIKLNINWEGSPQAAYSLTTVPDHIHHDGAIQPGPNLQTLPKEFLDTRGTVIYDRAQIHWFWHKVYPLIQPWFRGDADSIKIMVEQERTHLELGRSRSVAQLSRVGQMSSFTDTSFLTEAKRYAGRQEEQGRYVSFQATSPTYAVMTDSQKKWYFCWRTQVRRGHYLNTDLAYVLVYIYELIHKVGVEDSEEGYQRLLAIWLQYRLRIPILDQFLIDWLVDYRLFYQLPEPLKPYIMNASAPPVFQVPEIVFAQYAQEGLIRLSMDLLVYLLDYDPQRSRFYQANRSVLEQEIPQVLQYLDRVFGKMKGKGLFDQIPMATHTIRRRPFEGVPGFSYDRSEIVIAKIKPYTTHKPLRKYLTAIVRYSENKLRHIHRYKTLLPVAGLDPFIKRQIDRYFDRYYGIPQAERDFDQEVKIDFEAVARLQRESSDIVSLLLSDDEEAVHADPPTEDASKSSEKYEDQNNKPIVFSESSQWTVFFQTLAPYQLNAVIIMVNQDDVKAKLKVLATSHSIMIQSLIDEINEIALDTIGDLLIDGYDSFLLNEEYHEQLISMIQAMR